MRTHIVVLPFLTLIQGCHRQSQESGKWPERASLERGRYLIKVGGCNDCHTPEYNEKAGAIDEKLWLTGDVVGWEGPWGTTCPSNLRIHMQQLTEEQWLAEARKREMRLPMPYYIFRIMPDEDLRSVYRFIHSLGPAGADAPVYLPPGVEASPPVLKLILPPTHSELKQ